MDYTEAEQDGIFLGRYKKFTLDRANEKHIVRFPRADEELFIEFVKILTLWCLKHFKQ
jgi:hypothetical protein